nr:acyltransferase [Prosthecomicrobium pneumaticum]
MNRNAADGKRADPAQRTRAAPRAARGISRAGRSAISSAGRLAVGALVQGRIDVVDGLRGVAIAAVVFHHLFARGIGDLGLLGGWLLGNGWLGVDLFFVLSGFVLSLPYARGLPPGTRAFYARRVRRLAPLFYVVAAVSTAVTVLICGAPVDRGLLFQTAALLSGLFTFHPATFMPQANWVLWSLGVEFVFSALFPLLVRRPARLPQLTAAAVLLCPFVRAAGYALGERQYLDWISAGPAGRLDEFLLGMLVAQLYAQGRLPRSPRLAAATGLIMLLCAGLLFHLWAGGLFPRFVAAAFISLAALGFALILAAALVSRGRLRRALVWPPLQALGVACYSIYVWHGILLLGLFGTRDFDRIPVWSPLLFPYLAMLALVSWASFRFVEGILVRPSSAPREAATG